MPRVNWSTQLSQVYLPIPDEKDQEEIVLYLDELSEKTYQTVHKVRNQIEIIKDYRKSLIHECVTGKKQVVEGEVSLPKAKVI